VTDSLSERKEGIMKTERTQGDTQSPKKEKVREYMEHRRAEHKPPPSIEEIRRQLGWKFNRPKK
jgi:hypothetical protein